MGLLALPRILRFIINHPLNANQKTKALFRFIRWQIGSRLIPGSFVVDFVNSSRLLVKPGMMGATGILYTGLYEFEDMGFVMHALREGDRFVDVGANIGGYTVLASAAVGAKCIAIEPIPRTFEHLRNNVNLNGVYKKVQCLNLGVSSKAGILKFTSSLDTRNYIVTGEDSDIETIDVPAKSLDEIAKEFRPSLIKIDVEGFETEVISGAKGILSQDSLFAVIMELNGLGEKHGFDELALHEQMIEYGFKSYTYSPFDRELRPLESRNLSAGNTLYIRNVNLIAERVQKAAHFFVNGQWV